MALTGNSNEERIWNYLRSAGLSACGAAGLMGNLYAESGLIPTNLQNSYEKKLGYTDAEYTAAVDSGAYTNFAGDAAGYGLAQWTYSTRKANLHKFAKSAGKSIGDLETQMAFLIKELSGYASLFASLKTATSVRAASDRVLLEFERPADQSEAVKVKRAGFGQKYYDKYAGAASGAAPAPGGKSMTENELRSKVVSIAVSYLGCKESDGSHKKIIDLYNSHKPLARGYPVKYTDAWCSTFASAVAIKAGLTDIIPTECGCEKHIQLFKALGSWQENDAYVPKPADYVFYDWDDNGVGDCTGSADHVGIVEKVVGSTITVIEGNYSNAVKRRSLQVNGRYIRGYGVPKYASKATANSTTGAATVAGAAFAVGDKVNFIGSTHYTSSTAASGVSCKHGTAKVTAIAAGAKHPYHLIKEAGGGSSVYGWVDAADIVGRADNPVAVACAKLTRLGVINSPDYWIRAAASGKVKYLDILITKAAEKVTKTGPRSSTPENGIGALVAAGVINTPEYWAEHYHDIASLGALLCALGGAVK